MSDPRRALVERLYAAWLLAPHLSFGKLIGIAVFGGAPSVGDDDLVLHVERFAEQATLGPPATPGFVPLAPGQACPNHPPPETLEEIQCVACGAFRPSSHYPVKYVAYIGGQRTGWQPQGKTWVSR